MVRVPEQHQGHPQGHPTWCSTPFLVRRYEWLTIFLSFLFGRISQPENSLNTQMLTLTLSRKMHFKTHVCPNSTRTRPLTIAEVLGLWFDGFSIWVSAIFVEVVLGYSVFGVTPSVWYPKAIHLQTRLCLVCLVMCMCTSFQSTMRRHRDRSLYE